MFLDGLRFCGWKRLETGFGQGWTRLEREVGEIFGSVQFDI